MIRLCGEAGRVQIELKCIEMGSDICVVIIGGDRPHLGATALVQVRPSMINPNVWSSSVSVLTLLGHKEDKLAYKAADQLATTLGKNVVVSCGIHLDMITEEEIVQTESLVEKLVEELVGLLKCDIVPIIS